MTKRNRRKTARALFGVPVQIDSDAGPIEARLVDVSLTGARIRIPASAMGYAPSFDLAETALQLAARLAPRFEARLHYQVLGPLLHRGLKMMRIAVPADAPEEVELGCCFDRALSLDEVMALGVAQATLAPRTASREGAADAAEESETPLIPRIHGGVARRYRAYINGTLGISPPIMPCWSDQLDRNAIRIRMPRDGYEAEDVAGATVRFISHYGNEVGLKLVEGATHLWTGRTRVCGVELPGDPRADLLLTLAFSRRLRPAELRRLRLESVPA
jgi:hypothetical protein